MATKEQIEWALRQTNYKYFGDYEMSEDQHKAVSILEEVARDALATMATPAPRS